LLFISEVSDGHRIDKSKYFVTFKGKLKNQEAPLRKNKYNNGFQLAGNQM
jgi:hypothetical protein